MIKEFKNNEMRRSGVIYNSLLEQIKEMFLINKEVAGELAISAIEQVLTGDISSDNDMIKVMLKPFEKINENNQVKYDRKVDASKEKKKQENHLEETAMLFNQGLTQKKIGEMFGLSQQTISKRIKMIREEFPELLQPNTTENGCTTVVQDSTSCTSCEEVVEKTKFYF